MANIFDDAQLCDTPNLPIHPSDKEALEAIDAMVFSSDVLFSTENQLYFKKYLDRWQRWIGEHPPEGRRGEDD